MESRLIDHMMSLGGIGWNDRFTAGVKQLKEAYARGDVEYARQATEFISTATSMALIAQDKARISHIFNELSGLSILASKKQWGPQGGWDALVSVLMDVNYVERMFIPTLQLAGKEGYCELLEYIAKRGGHASLSELQATFSDGPEDESVRKRLDELLESGMLMKIKLGGVLHFHLYRNPVLEAILPLKEFINAITPLMESAKHT